jgi:hypothetical protein
MFRRSYGSFYSNINAILQSGGVAGVRATFAAAGALFLVAALLAAGWLPRGRVKV